MEPSYDLNYLRAGVKLLKNYVLSDELYWEIGLASPSGMPPYPQLTLGNMLLSQARLSGRSLEPSNETELQSVVADLEDIHTRWAVAWEVKATREFGARLKLWADYLEEYRDNPGGQIDRYDYEVRRRVILDLLQSDGAKVDEARARLLGGMDAMLKSVLEPAEFIWDRELRASFPKDRYWYLFGRPRPE